VSGTPISLFVGNTAILEVSLVDVLTDSAVNAATVAVTLTDISGVELAGDTWPKTLSYVSGSEGIYRALLSSNVDMEEGANYLYVATASAAGMDSRWSGDVNAVRRSF